MFITASQPMRVHAYTEGANFPLLPSNGGFSARDLRVSMEESNGAVCICLLSGDTAVKEITLTYHAPLPDDCLILNDQWERGYGDLMFRKKSDVSRVLPWYFLAYRDGLCQMFGVRVRPRAMCYFTLERDTVTLHLNTCCGTHGVKLCGRLLDLAQLVTLESTLSPYQALRSFCRLLCDDARKLPLPIYGTNNWYYAYGSSSHKQIVRDAVLLESLTKNLINRPYLVIDDGWQKDHNPSVGYNGGPWDAGNEKFPNMQELAEDIAAHGAHPGIWFRPLLTTRPIPEEARLRGNPSFLDPSTPYALEKIAADMHRLSSWGYRMIKHDFSTFDMFGMWGFSMTNSYTEGDWSFHDQTRTNAEVVLDFYATLRKAAPDAVIIGCNTLSHLSAGYFELQRTGDDTSGTDWERTLKYGVNTLAFRMPQHRIFYACDADCVGITGKIPWELNKKWLSLLKISGTPLFVSPDPDAMTDEICTDIADAFAIASTSQYPSEPLDWMETPLPSDWRSEQGIVHFSWN